jgi:16S rRNA (cytosine1402-N4)-methyltransferase
MATFSTHQPVLFEEALGALDIRSTGYYVDGTFGRGGHSRAILERLDVTGRLLAIDKDPDAIAHGEALFQDDQRLIMEQCSFARLDSLTEQLGWTGRVDGVLLDLGVSSPQLDVPERGFSFSADGVLDMRMDNTRGISAADWLASAELSEIAGVIKKFGEERFSKRIATGIVAARELAPITTTGQLAEIITAAVPVREKSKHPATRSFQAIRIYINGELEDLQQCLAQTLSVLAPGGRLVVVSFHSLEDRIVKRFMRDQARGDDFPPGLPVTQAQLHPRLKILGKAIRPSQQEVNRNPRSRSAVLRVAERLS